MTRFAWPRHVLALALVAALSGCEERPPAPNRPDHPQTGTELRDAAQAPQDKARAVEQQVLDAAKRQREEIDRASGD